MKRKSGEDKMSRWSSEQEAREELKALVTEYYHDFKEKRNRTGKGSASITRRAYLMKRKCAP